MESRSSRRGRVCLRALTLAVTLALGITGLAPAAVADEESPTTSTETLSYATMTRPNSTTTWRTGAGTITVDAWGVDRLSINMYGGPEGRYGTVRVGAPNGDPLTVGVYDDAVRDRVGGEALIDYSYGSSGCSPVGRFDILELNEDRSRVWLRYEGHCGNDATFGEIRVGMPVQGGAAVLPSAVAWPAEYPQVAGPATEVTVVNTGGTPLTLGAPAITTGVTDFSIAGTTCSSVPAGGSCAITLGFRPTTTGARSGTLSLAGVPGVTAVALSGSGDPRHTSWTSFHPTAGPSWSFTPTTAEFQVGARQSGASIYVSPKSWHNGYGPDLDIRGPKGQRLEPNTTYAGAQDYHWGPDDLPGIDLTEHSTACGASEGEFTTHEVEYDSRGALTALSATYTFRCGSGSSPIIGSFAWQTTNPAPPLPGVAGVAPFPVSGLKAAVTYDTATLTWAMPTVPDWTRTIVRVAVGTTPPASPTAGSAVYSGRAATVTTKGLRTDGKSLAFAVFTEDSEGFYSAGVPLVLKGSGLGINASAKTVAYFSDVVFTGKLTNSQTGAALSGHKLELWAHRPGKQDWFIAARGKTDTKGRYSLSFPPAVKLEYWVYSLGSPTTMGSFAGPVRVKVKPGAALGARYSSAPLGTTLEFAAAVGPADPGATVRLQHLVGSTWVTVASGKLKKNKATIFRTRPTSRGTHSYRAYWSSGKTTAISSTVQVRIR